MEWVIRVPENQVGIDSYRDAGYQGSGYQQKSMTEEVIKPDTLMV